MQQKLPLINMLITHHVLKNNTMAKALHNTTGHVRPSRAAWWRSVVSIMVVVVTALPALVLACAWASQHNPNIIKSAGLVPANSINGRCQKLKNVILYLPEVCKKCQYHGYLEMTQM